MRFSIAANKEAGVRPAVCCDAETASGPRRCIDANDRANIGRLAEIR